jgi:hypothetical protein
VHDRDAQALRARAERVQLVVHALLEHLALGDEAPPVAHRRGQRIERRILGRASLALAQQVDERRAVAVVGLEAARAELRPGGLRLGWREQPQRAGEAALELARERLVQRAGRLDPDQRRGRRVLCDQPLELIDAVSQRRQRAWLFDQSVALVRNPDSMMRFARVDGDEQCLRRGGNTQ